AVTDTVDSVILEILRHDLGEAHGAGPRAFHLGASRTSVLHDLELGDQLIAELVRAPPHKGLRHHRADRVIWRVDLAEPGLPAPDRHHDARRHTVFLLDRGERRPELGDLGAAGGR